MKLPKHINLTIEHNPHASYYEDVARWLAGDEMVDRTEIDPADRAEMLRLDEIWVITWYPDTPVGSHRVAAATLERVLELANDAERWR